MYEKYCDKLQSCFDRKNIELLFIDTDSFVLIVNTKDIIRDLKNQEEL